MYTNTRTPEKLMRGCRRQPQFLHAPFINCTILHTYVYMSYLEHCQSTLAIDLFLFFHRPLLHAMFLPTNSFLYHTSACHRSAPHPQPLHFCILHMHTSALLPQPSTLSTSNCCPPPPLALHNLYTYVEVYLHWYSEDPRAQAKDYCFCRGTGGTVGVHTHTHTPHTQQTYEHTTKSLLICLS